MSRAISQALNIRVVSMTGRKAISPSGHHITVAAATCVPFTRSSLSSSLSAKPRRRTEQEEQNHRDNTRSHQAADILGLAWDPELEPDFRGPLFESAAEKSQSKKKNSGASGLAEDASTTMEEALTMEVSSTTSSSSSRSGGDSGLSSGGLSDTSDESTSSSGSSSVSEN